MLATALKSDMYDSLIPRWDQDSTDGPGAHPTKHLKIMIILTFSYLH